jgi:uncharacterized membrane protein YqjE
MADDRSTSELGESIQQVAEKASLLVREEIELAKAEMTEKVTKLIKGAVVGIVAGIFAVAGLIYLLHALSWLLWKLIDDGDNFYLGFLIVAGVLFLLGGVAGFLAARFLKGGTPPTPALAIEEAQLIKETVQSSRPAKPVGPTAAVQAPNPSQAEVHN